MIFARSQVWGTLKRYLMYTTAGFIVMGGLGAAWSHRPVTLSAAAANPFDGAKLAEQFAQVAALETPIWTQRLAAELTILPSQSESQQLAEATHADKFSAQEPRAQAEQPEQTQVQLSDRDAQSVMRAKLGRIAQATFARSDVTASQLPASTQADLSVARATSEPQITLPGTILAADERTADLAPLTEELDEREASAAFADGWQNGENSLTDAAADDIRKVIEVRPGDTLYGVLVDAGVTEDEAKDAVGAIADVFSPRDLRAGQEITLNISTASGTRRVEADPQLVSLTFEPDVVTDVTLTRSGSGDFVAAAIDKELVDTNRRVAGMIDSSLFDAAQEAGVPMPVVADLIKTFSFDVDFQRDIQDGDSFELVYERKETATGDFVKSGKILFASLTLSGKTIPVYYFERDGEGEYFTPKGETIRKSLLRTPIDGARITSGFGMRMHPLLGYSKMHKGVDFGAPTGTPIYAAGSGTIVEMGRKGSYGNYIRIRHNGEYQTAYAHMSRFAKGLSKGERVKQGDVIGYVGTTGRSTGPHLHYEVMVAGAQVNPAKVKTTSGDKLTGKQLKAFQAQMAKIDAERKRQADQQLIAESSGSIDSCGIDQGCQN